MNSFLKIMRKLILILLFLGFGCIDAMSWEFNFGGKSYAINDLLIIGDVQNVFEKLEELF